MVLYSKQYSRIKRKIADRNSYRRISLRVKNVQSYNERKHQDKQKYRKYCLTQFAFFKFLKKKYILSVICESYKIHYSCLLSDCVYVCVRLLSAATCSGDDEPGGNVIRCCLTCMCWHSLYPTARMQAPHFTVYLVSLLSECE